MHLFSKDSSFNSADRLTYYSGGHHCYKCLEWHEETEQTETDSIQKNCGDVSKMLQETFLLS